MTNTAEDLCNEDDIYFLLPKFGTNLLTPSIFMSYLFSTLLQCFDSIL